MGNDDNKSQFVVSRVIARIQARPHFSGHIPRSTSHTSLGAALGILGLQPRRALEIAHSLYNRILQQLRFLHPFQKLDVLSRVAL